jgi:V/A-type H+/Na+-transporting ATPase subunit K
MERWMKMSKRFNLVLGIGAFLLFSCAPLAFVRPALAAAESGAAASVQAEQGADAPPMTADAHAKVRCWAFLAAALATGIGSLAAGYAVGHVGAAAMGAVAEKPELMGKSLIYVALAEGIAIYGLLISIIVLAKV